MSTRTLPDGSTIDYGDDHSRTWTQPDGSRLHSERYGPWEPIFPSQECPACGLEHPGLPCQQPDLFGEQPDLFGEDEL